MKERKKYKGTVTYTKLDKEIKRDCIKAKDIWANKKCEKIEGLSKGLETKEMFKEIKDFTNKGSKTGGCIKSKDGKILFETEKILARWTEYVEELFYESRLRGPEIIKSEVENCLKQMASGKAPGIDNISSEALQALDESGIETLTELCNEMYSASYVPADLRTSVFIVLPKKKPRAVECAEFRTISLICHTLKLLLTMILRRISDKINREVGDEQAGFRKNSSTREGIFNLKMIVEKYIETQKDIYACFIDFSKAFDTVNHEKLIKCLKTTDMIKVTLLSLQTFVGNKIPK